MKIKSLIIGLGQIGMTYDLNLDPQNFIYTYLRAFSKNPIFEITAAVDLDINKHNHFSNYYDSPVYTKVEDALNIHNVDLVVIASSTLSHFSVFKQVIEVQKPKVIICEKPLSYSLNEAQEMVSICKHYGIALFVNYMRRADIGVIEIKKRIECGEIALPITGVSWYSKGFMNNGSHFFNVLQYWLGPLKEFDLLSHGRKVLNFNDSEPEVRVKFRGGEVLFLPANEDFFSYYTIELISPSGRLFYDKGGKLITWSKAQLDANFIGYKSLHYPPEIIENDMNFYQLNVIKNIENFFMGRPCFLCTGEEALETIIAMSKIISEK